MSAVSVNQDLGGGWRLVSIEKPEPELRIYVLVLTYTVGSVTTSFTSQFNAITAMMLTPPFTLTMTQIHLIEVAIAQLVG